MTTPNDGGPAFPKIRHGGPDGMSLRQWYVGQAIQTAGACMLAQIQAGVWPKGNEAAEIASFAHEIADACLKHQAEETATP